MAFAKLKHTPGLTLASAIKWFRLKVGIGADNRGPGCHCPLCGKAWQKQVRPMNATALKALLLFYYKVKERPARNYYHWWRTIYPNPEHGLTMGGDFAKLRHWGLIEPKPADSPGKSDGFYRITDRGRKFINGEIALPGNVIIWRGQMEGVEGKPIYVWDALGGRTDWRELMKGRDKSLLRSVRDDKPKKRTNKTHKS